MKMKLIIVELRLKLKVVAFCKQPYLVIQFINIFYYNLGVKPDYRINSWVELKRILSVYGYFRIYPKHNSAIIIFRKL